MGKVKKRFLIWVTAILLSTVLVACSPGMPQLDAVAPDGETEITQTVEDTPVPTGTMLTR